LSEQIVPAPRLLPQVEICSHRGASHLAPENTLPALEKAVELGCEYLEIDIRTTADGELVVIHNHTVDATTNGTGEVESFSLAEIKALDAGSKFSPAFCGTRIATFAEALDCAKGRAITVAEIKRASVEAVVKVIHSVGARDEVVVLTGVEWLAQLRAQDPAIAVMGQPWHMNEVVPVLERLKPEYLLLRWKPGRETTTFAPDTIEAGHRAGARICLNLMGEKETPEGIRDAIAAGIDIIETDAPELVHQVATAMGQRAAQS